MSDPITVIPNNPVGASGITVAPSSPVNPPNVTTTVATGRPIEVKFVVGVTPGTSDGMVLYQDAVLISKVVSVFVDGVLLYPGLVDRQSYTYNQTTGEITFTVALYNGQTVIIHAE